MCEDIYKYDKELLDVKRINTIKTEHGHLECDQALFYLFVAIVAAALRYVDGVGCNFIDNAVYIVYATAPITR